MKMRFLLVALLITAALICGCDKKPAGPETSPPVFGNGLYELKDGEFRNLAGTDTYNQLNANFTPTPYTWQVINPNGYWLTTGDWDNLAAINNVVVCDSGWGSPPVYPLYISVGSPTNPPQVINKPVTSINSNLMRFRISDDFVVVNWPDSLSSSPNTYFINIRHGLSSVDDSQQGSHTVWKISASGIVRWPVCGNSDIVFQAMENNGGVLTYYRDNLVAELYSAQYPNGTLLATLAVTLMRTVPPDTMHLATIHIGGGALSAGTGIPVTPYGGGGGSAHIWFGP